MSGDWQTWAAAGVVLITALAFALRSLKRKKHGGCNTCGSADPPVKRPWNDPQNR
jgi:hypothetical protein